MKRLVSAPEVDESLREIYRYTFARWGEAQARKYLAELRAAYLSLAHEPAAGRVLRSVKGILLRQLQVGRHVMVYTVRDDEVLVLSILHEAMNIRARITKLVGRMRRRGVL